MPTVDAPEPVSESRAARRAAREERRRNPVLPPIATERRVAVVLATVVFAALLALATTAAPESVPPEAGVLSNDPEVLRAAARRLLADPAEARALGDAGRAHALARFSLGRFLDDWDRTLKEVAS